MSVNRPGDAPRRLPEPDGAGDTGQADPVLVAAIVAHAADAGRLPDVLAALHVARVLTPVVAIAGEPEVGADGLRSGSSAEVAVPILTGEDGRRALPAFTSLETLARFDPAARPVPVPGARAAAVALAEHAEVLVIDVAGPQTSVLELPELRALTEGRGRVPAYDDDALADTLGELVAGALGDGDGHAVRRPARAVLVPAAGADARLLLPVAAGVEAAGSAAAALVAERVRTDETLQARAIRGLQVAATPTPTPSPPTPSPPTPW